MILKGLFIVLAVIVYLLVGGLVTKFLRFLKWDGGIWGVNWLDRVDEVLFKPKPLTSFLWPLSLLYALISLLCAAGLWLWDYVVLVVRYVLNGYTHET